VTLQTDRGKSAVEILEATMNRGVVRLHDRDDGRARFLVTICEYTAKPDAWDLALAAIEARPDWAIEASDKCVNSTDYRLLVAVSGPPDEAERDLVAIVESVDPC
jgi:hypothetical protein